MSHHRLPSHKEFIGYAETALADIPAPFREEIDGIAILVEDFPDPETVREMRVESPYYLLGLYSGVSLNHKSVNQIPYDQDRIFLYRRPILAYSQRIGLDVETVVRHVLVHEIGHHFGLSDADMEALEEEEDDGEA